MHGWFACVLLAATTACTVGDVDFEGKTCPCRAPFVCDTARDECRLSGGSAYADTVLGDGPIMYLRMNEADGALAADASGNGNDCTIRGGVTLGAAGVIPGDGAFDLDGSTGALACGEAPFDFAGTSPYTLEAWVAPRSTDLIVRLFTKESGSTGSRNGYTFFLDGREDSISLDVQSERWLDAALANRPEAPRVVPTDGTWTHLVYVYESPTERLYVNGTDVGSASAPTALMDNDAPFVVGSQSSQANGFYPGLIDEVAVYDRALDGERIRAHFDAR